MKNRDEWARQSPDIELKLLWHALLRNKEMKKVFGFTFSFVQNDMSHAHLELFLAIDYDVDATWWDQWQKD